MKNYKIIVQYDGSEYSGWQIQPNNRTVQEEIRNAIKTIIKGEVNLIGSGRTDTGVHALGQTANFRCESTLELEKFVYSLNSIMPKSIAVKCIEEVPEEFHARFDARKREYLYLITKKKSPFYYKYSYFYSKDLNVYNLNKLSQELIGKRDFRSFAKESDENSGTDCEIFSAFWSERKDFYIFSIEANRFLRGMVRTIVGTLLESERKELCKDHLKEIILSKKRENAGMSVPPNGLFLYKVRY
ncbi:MAG: tRNA pseudouridine(38-40) synthase TruA [Ignavibacteriaceae bacterium]